MVGLLGHPFVGTADFKRFTYVWCKDNKVPSENGKPLAKVPIPAVCIGAEGRPASATGIFRPRPEQSLKCAGFVLAQWGYSTSGQGGVRERGQGVTDVDQPLGITIESLAPDTVCVSLSGELDFSRAYTFDEEIRRLESHEAGPDRPRPAQAELHRLGGARARARGPAPGHPCRAPARRRARLPRGRAAVRAERARHAARDGQRATRGAAGSTGVAIVHRPELARLLERAERVVAERGARRRRA